MSSKQAVRAIVLQNDKLLVMERNKFGMHYYTLVGGGVDVGEDTETAIRRELMEETGMTVGNLRLVYIEDAGAMYGVQYIYFCEYLGGEPVLSPQSEEALINAGGQNTYQPMWLPVAEVATVAFRSASVQAALLEAYHGGFPETPQTLAWEAEDVSR